MQPEGGMPTPHPQGIPMEQPAPMNHKTTVTGAQFAVIEEGEDGEPRQVLKEHVVIFHSTAAGTAVAVWALDTAEKIALDIYAAVRKMRSNIVIPGDGSNLREIVREAMEKELREKGELPDA